MELQKVKISSVAKGNRVIDGTLITPENPKPKNPAILLIHGWRSSQERYVSRAKVLAELGYICLTFDLPGHGSSEGDIRKLTRQDYLNDIVTVYDYLKNLENVDEDKISIIGASFGGYLGAILTKKRPAKSLVLRVPANYEDDGFENLPQDKYRETKDLKAWREKELDYYKTISLKAVHEYPHKILIIESEKDEEVPHQTIMNYCAAVADKSKLTHRIMEGADHSIHDERFQQEFIEILKEWFAHPG